MSNMISNILGLSDGEVAPPPPPETAEHTHALALWVRRLEMRSNLTEADRQEVMGFPGRLQEYRSSRDIVRIGERTKRSTLVVRGVVARFGQVADGNRQLTAFFIPGDMADLHSAVMPLVTAPLQSTSAVVAYHVPHEAIIAATERSATLSRAFWRDCVSDSQAAAEWLVNIGQRNALARLAHLLCEFACRFRAAGGAAGQFPLAPTQADLGAALGLTGVHVNRMLRVLRERGLIRLADNLVDVLDWPGLMRAGEFDPAYLHLSRETTD